MGTISILERAEARLYCTELSRELLDTIKKLNEKNDIYIAIVPLTLAERVGVEAILSAATAACIAWQRGAGIARVKGLDTLLYLTGSRNIGRVVAEHGPKPGDQVVVVALACGDPKEPLLELERAIVGGSRGPAGACRLPQSRPEHVTKAAIMPIEARVYR